MEAYLASGPALIFLFHPALGPLWDVVAQKLRGGSLAPRSELVLEVAEAQVEGLHLQVRPRRGGAGPAGGRSSAARNSAHDSCQRELVVFLCTGSEVC